MASTLLLVVVFAFDLIAFGLAVAAEKKRGTLTITTGGRDRAINCLYLSDTGTGFRVVSLLFLSASQLIITVASRCLCCGRALQKGKSRKWAIVLFIMLNCMIICLSSFMTFTAATYQISYVSKAGEGSIPRNILDGGIRMNPSN
uniref:Uncharacterized protein LOC104235749 n=1 Tax=Nicotiana sylvestris TaxID=4096 RepID=A0A1U7XAH5_NICSY|nr:PREDICTED: uncharacterized protein LOC104235749 [Nicotiana sylvestris]